MSNGSFKFSSEEKEAFFEMNVIAFDDDSNLKKVYSDSYENVGVYLEKIKDGEVIDEPSCVFELTKLLMSAELLKIKN